jgi:RNA polymerase sigma factor for flagellar operon FliA
MLSELRISHPMRRGVSDRRRQLQRAEERLVHKLHHTPTAAELAVELETPEAVVARWQAEVAAAERHPSFAGRTASRRGAAGTTSSARGATTGTSGGGRRGDERADEPPDLGPQPDEIVLDLELLAALHRAIGDLPARLGLIVRATYFEGRRLADVAAELGVTESRISQLRTEAVSALRHRLQLDEHTT